jgi:hypothetical protein
VVRRFVGNNASRIDHEHRALTIAGDTEDARQRAVCTILVGLSTTSRAGLPRTDLDVSMKAGATTQAPARTRGISGSFQLNASGSYDEERAPQAQWNSASADRVTNVEDQLWRGDRYQHEFDLDEDEPFKARRYRSAEGFVARAWAPWSRARRTGRVIGVQQRVLGDDVPAVECAFPLPRVRPASSSLQYALASGAPVRN